MSASKRRYATLRAIVSSSSVPNLHSVDREFQNLEKTSQVAPLQRRFLLQALHSTRAFDTALRRILQSQGLVPGIAIGPMLRQLKALPLSSPSHLPTPLHNQYQQTIGKVRNRFMHEADMLTIAVQICQHGTIGMASKSSRARQCSAEHIRTWPKLEKNSLQP